MSTWANTIPLSATPQLAGSYMAPRYNPLISPDSQANRSWLLEAIQEGEAFLKNNLAYPDIDRAINIICGLVEEKLPKKLSNVSSNRIKRNIREMVAILSNLRPFWGYTSGDRRFDDQAELYNKLMTGWFHDCFADQSIKEALQVAAVEGTGYLLVDWDPHYWPDGSGDVSLRPISARNVLPVQLPSSKNIQHAYAVLIREEMPIAQAWARWPEFKDKIRPDRFDTQRGANKILYPFHALVAGFRQRTQNTKSAPWPVVDIYYAYIVDPSHNDSMDPMIVGGGSRGPTYTVPYTRQPLPDGRLASPQDCILFPDRRLMIGTNTCIMYDGPSFWIHGMAPVAKFSLDEWFWEYLGFSLVKDVASIQRSRTSLMRSIDDSANLRLRPPMVGDKSSLAKTEYERFDPRQPGQKIMADMQLTGGEVIKPIFNPQQFDVPQFIPAYVQYLDEMTDFLMGQPGMKELAKANQIPSSDSIEKFLEMSGSIAQDMSRSMEKSLRTVGQLVLGNFIQYYSLPRRLKVLGRDGITREDLDYEPGNLVPADATISYEQRMRNHYRRFTYRTTPNSMTQMQSMSTRLLYLQLSKSGFPVDWFSIAKLLDIPNFAPEPEGTNNMLERWEWQQEFLLKLQMKAQAEMQGMAQPANPLEAILGALGGGGQGGQGGQGGAGGAQGGRPPSFKKAPEMEQKDGGTRTTVTTS